MLKSIALLSLTWNIRWPERTSYTRRLLCSSTTASFCLEALRSKHLIAAGTFSIGTGNALSKNIFRTCRVRIKSNHNFVYFYNLILNVLLIFLQQLKTIFIKIILILGILVHSLVQEEDLPYLLDLQQLWYIWLKIPFAILFHVLQ